MFADMSMRIIIRKRRRLQNNIEKKINGVTSGVGTVYLSGAAPEFLFLFLFFGGGGVLYIL